MWQTFQILVEQWKRREFEPQVAVLRECKVEAKAAGRNEADTRRRIGEVLDFFETIRTWYESKIARS